CVARHCRASVAAESDESVYLSSWFRLVLDHFLIKWSGHLEDLPSFPTRRSSDLSIGRHEELAQRLSEQEGDVDEGPRRIDRRLRDRKSTRLNSSHVKISYAVFCLKKKT